MMTIFLLPCCPEPAINDLVLLVFYWPVLRCPSLAGFQVSPEAQVSLNYCFQIGKGVWPLRRSRKLSQIQSPDAGLQGGHDGFEGPRRCQAESFDLYSSYRHPTPARARPFSSYKVVRSIRH